MAEFRKSPKGSAVKSATLHTGNKGIHYYFKGDDAGKKKLEVTSTDATIADVESVKMNDDKQGIRQVNFKAKKAGPVTIQAKIDGKLVAELSITVEDKISLPDSKTEAGMFARLLIAESRTPWDKTYNETNVKTGMEWMHLVVHNRLNSKPEFFNAKGAKNLIDIVKGKNQFAGFADYPTINKDVQELIHAAIENANDDNHDKQAEYIVFVKNALEVANTAKPIADPASPSILAYWRTAGATKPEKDAVLHRTLAKNDFYKITKP